MVLAMGECWMRRLIGKSANMRHLQSASCGEQYRDKRCVDRARTAVVVKPSKHLQLAKPNAQGERGCALDDASMMIVSK